MKALIFLSVILMSSVACADEFYIHGNEKIGMVKAVMVLATNSKKPVYKCTQVELKENKSSIGLKKKTN